MKILVNDVDTGLMLETLEEAIEYHMPSEEEMEDCAGDTDFIKYVEAIKNATSLEDLADTLNSRTDIYSDGRTYKVKTL